MNKYPCKCGRIYKRDDDYAKWNRSVYCSDCGDFAFIEGFSSTGNTTYGLPGYNSPGYNEGLGTHIRSKQHLKEVMKQQNVTEAG